MRSTIVDIKNRTGLSLATISKYLNGGNVLPENKAKIDEAVKALNYQVNENARSLVTNQTRIMGVIVFSVENLFVGTLLRYLGEILREHGYGMMICDSNNNIEAEKQNIRSMVQKNVDGIVIMPVSEDAEIMRPADNVGIPYICLDRTFPDCDCDSVLVNNRETTRKLIEILICRNHTRIAILSSRNEYTGKERLDSFLDTLRDAGIPVPPEYIILEDLHSISAGYHGMQRLLSLETRPTAVFLSNYEVLMGAFMAVNESEYRCPDDLSLVAFDNMFADVVRPRITVGVQPMEELASRTVELLLMRTEERRQGEESPRRHIVLPVEIQENESVRCL